MGHAMKTNNKKNQPNKEAIIHVHESLWKCFSQYREIYLGMINHSTKSKTGITWLLCLTLKKNYVKKLTMFFHLIKNTRQQGNSKKSYRTTEKYKSLDLSGLFHAPFIQKIRDTQRLISKEIKKK